LAKYLYKKPLTGFISSGKMLAECLQQVSLTFAKFASKKPEKLPMTATGLATASF
jgi:hypothetical protein